MEHLFFQFNCRAQRSGVRLGNRDVAPVAALQSWPRECQMYVTVLAPRGPCKFGTRDLHLFTVLGVSKYISDRARYFLAQHPSGALDLEARWRYQANEFKVNVQSSFYRSVNGIEQAPRSNLARLPAISYSFWTLFVGIYTTERKSCTGVP